MAPTLLTEELCREAVDNYGDALEFVPYVLRNWWLCIRAYNNMGPRTLQWFPDKILKVHPDICLEAVSSSWKTLQFIPMDLRTPGICCAALLGTCNDAYAATVLGMFQENLVCQVQFLAALHRYQTEQQELGVTLQFTVSDGCVWEYNPTTKEKGVMMGTLVDS